MKDLPLFDDVTVTSIHGHRNGVGGKSFYAIHFTLSGEDEPYYNGDCIAIVTDDADECYVVKPSDPETKYRGDNFEPLMRAYIAKYEAEETEKWAIKAVAREA
jgi:hypothetical protein